MVLSFVNSNDIFILSYPHHLRSMVGSNYRLKRNIDQLIYNEVAVLHRNRIMLFDCSNRSIVACLLFILLLARRGFYHHLGDVEVKDL